MRKDTAGIIVFESWMSISGPASNFQDSKVCFLNKILFQDILGLESIIRDVTEIGGDCA